MWSIMRKLLQGPPYKLSVNQNEVKSHKHACGHARVHVVIQEVRHQLFLQVRGIADTQLAPEKTTPNNFHDNEPRLQLWLVSGSAERAAAVNPPPHASIRALPRGHYASFSLHACGVGGDDKWLCLPMKNSLRAPNTCRPPFTASSLCAFNHQSSQTRE